MGAVALLIKLSYGPRETAPVPPNSVSAASSVTFRKPSPVARSAGQGFFATDFMVDHEGRA